MNCSTVDCGWVIWGWDRVLKKIKINWNYVKATSKNNDNKYHKLMGVYEMRILVTKIIFKHKIRHDVFCVIRCTYYLSSHGFDYRKDETV